MGWFLPVLGAEGPNAVHSSWEGQLMDEEMIFRQIMVEGPSAVYLLFFRWWGWWGPTAFLSHPEYGLENSVQEVNSPLPRAWFSTKQPLREGLLLWIGFAFTILKLALLPSVIRSALWWGRWSTKGKRTYHLIFKSITCKYFEELLFLVDDAGVWGWHCWSTVVDFSTERTVSFIKAKTLFKKIQGGGSKCWYSVA